MLYYGISRWWGDLCEVTDVEAIHRGYCSGDHEESHRWIVTYS